jgi:hypothetical protein
VIVLLIILLFRTVLYMIHHVCENFYKVETFIDETKIDKKCSDSSDCGEGLKCTAIFGSRSVCKVPPRPSQ